MTHVITRCVDCDLAFSLAAGEIEWYQARNFPAPKRCPACRRTRRKLKATGVLAYDAVKAQEVEAAQSKRAVAEKH